MSDIYCPDAHSVLCIKQTMVLLILEYCDVIYNSCTIRDALALEQLQRRAALVCTGAYRHTSNDSLLAELGWQPLRVRRNVHKLCLFYKNHKLSRSILLETHSSSTANN